MHECEQCTCIYVCVCVGKEERDGVWVSGSVVGGDGLDDGKQR